MKSIPQKINTISQLQKCGFGQPWPRHGLQLLFWFAKDCIWVSDDDDMFLALDPTKENFGCHLFENRDNKHNGKLLPDVNFQYYLLGNLNLPGADMLPEYIHQHNTGQRDGNTDRIIVTNHGEWKFGKIYVTTHEDNKRSFDPYGTFHISRGLLKIIRSFPDLDDFLLAIGYQMPVFQMAMLSLTDTELAAYHKDKEETYDVSADTDTPSRNCICSCTIL